MRLTSSAFEEGGAIPARHTCRGGYLAAARVGRRSRRGEKPGAHLRRPGRADGHLGPLGGVRYTARDPRLPRGGPQDRQARGRREAGDDRLRRGRLRGPCPPSGTHRYFFTLYALDAKLDLAGTVTKERLLAAMKGPRARGGAARRNVQEVGGGVQGQGRRGAEARLRAREVPGERRVGARHPARRRGGGGRGGAAPRGGFLPVVSRKLPFPADPESGFGAIAEDGSVFIHEAAARWVARDEAEEIARAQRNEIRRRIRALRRAGRFPDPGEDGDPRRRRDRHGLDDAGKHHAVPAGGGGEDRGGGACGGARCRPGDRAGGGRGGDPRDPGGFSRRRPGVRGLARSLRQGGSGADAAMGEAAKCGAPWRGDGSRRRWRRRSGESSLRGTCPR